MSHVSKIVSLAAALLLFGGGVSLAGPPDPTKLISPSQSPGIQPALKLPDLVPVHLQYICSSKDLILIMNLGVKNQGTAKTTVAFKTRVKVNGVMEFLYDQWNPQTGSW